MKKSLLLISSAALLLSAAAHAQNIATVNGKPVPKARVDFLMKQVAAQAESQHQQLPPDIDQRAKEKVVLDEIFAQEAEKRGIAANADFKQQLEYTRQALMIQTLFKDYTEKNPVTDAEIRAEYDKYKATQSGTEYHARHILVEKEDEAVALIKEIKGGADFAELAKKNSKDTGSGANGGDLDFAAPSAYVPEFSEAMVKLKKGEITETPVKTQFGYHIIKLEDTREAKFPPLEEVKPQIQQRLAQQKLAAFRDELRDKAKTDFKFSGQ
ncbi:MAG: peptidylprolyl isomerase [Proteobacteria bacterium]|nr:peptidylprolyl isomerase [Pseudomonadota bacterium]